MENRFGTAQPARRPLASRQTRWAKALARKMADMRLRPNAISVLSLGFAFLAGMALLGTGRAAPLWRGVWFLIAGACIQLRLLCNLLDGMVAIEGGFHTKTGELYNEFPDRVSDAVILVCAAYAYPVADRWVWLGWMAALLAMTTAYVRALGAVAGARQHFSGPMAKPHRMALFTAVCAVMAVLAFTKIEIDLVHPALVVVCAGCAITVARRLHRIARDLEAR